MKIKIQKAKLLDALKKVQSAANAKTPLPILANVKINAAEGQIGFTTTNLDLTLYAEAECEVSEPGVTTVPMKMLFNVVCAMIDGEVEMELRNDKMRIKGGNYITNIGTMSVDTFPKNDIDKQSVELKFIMAKKQMRDLIRRSSYAMSQDDTRRLLKGVLFAVSEKGLNCVATDGRRLALVENDGDLGCKDEKSFIIPSLSIGSIQKFLEGDGDVVVEVTSTQARFCTDGGADEIITKLVDGVFPNYKAVVPSNTDKVAQVDRADLIGAVERVSVMATRSDMSIKMTFDDNRLLVEVKGDDFCDAHDEIPVKYSAEKVEIIFNPRYVLDVMRASDADEVEFAMNSGHSAAIIRNADEHMMCVLMPLRVNA